MRNNPLDDIVKCDIEISSPGSSDATFDTILVVAPQPDAWGEKGPVDVFAISTADELLDYGYDTSKVAYAAATVAFSQNPAPDRLLIAPRKLDGDHYEDMTALLARVAAQEQFYGISITTFMAYEDMEAAMKWTEANEKLLGLPWILGETGEHLKNMSYYRTFFACPFPADGYKGIEDSPFENQFLPLAIMAKCFGYDPGTETWNLKELAGIVPTVLSTQEKDELAELNVSTFLRYAGTNCFMGGKTAAGEWIDVIRFRDWLKNEMQINVFNALKTNKKVPYTDAGIQMLAGVMEAVLKKAQDIGGIAPNQYDSYANPTYGYTLTVPKAQDLTEAERKSRKLTGCKWTARLAGAIHVVEISGYLTF